MPDLATASSVGSTLAGIGGSTNYGVARLKREEFHGIFLYSALISRPAGLAKLVKFFADRVLETDASTVVSMFAGTKAISPEELEELERLIEKVEQDEER